jgi:hypothetical protein
LLFKRNITINEYLTTRLDLLFSSEQAERWLELKRACGDKVVSDLEDDLYLMHLRAASIVLLSMVLTKKYFRNDDIMFSMSMFIDKYLDHRNEPLIKHFIDLYSQAMGRIPTDGILAVAFAMLEYLCQHEYAQETLLGCREMFYDAVASFRADFKDVKLVAAAQR